MTRAWVPLVALGLLAGCYVYRPVSTVEPQVGMQVAAELTDFGSDTLARYVGPDVSTVRGDVIDAGDSGVILSVTSITDRSGRDQFWKGEQLRVPRGTVRIFERREFSLGRSLLLGAALLGGSVLAWEAFRGGTSGGGLPPGGGTGGSK